jgi:hypothetical protein
VRSVTHKALGRRAVKSRRTRSGGRTAAGSARVVNTLRRWRDTPRMPSWRIRRATWSRPMSCPSRRAAFHSLCAPYTLRLATHSTIKMLVMAASRRARADGSTSRCLAV